MPPSALSDTTDRSLVELGAGQATATRSRAGLPVGLELDGALGTDTRLLVIALGIEAVLGRLPPPPEG